MGVSESEFWKLNPRKVDRLIQAEHLRISRQLDYDNTVAFIQGAYIAEAILSTVVNFLGGKGSRKHEYPAKPYNLSTDTDINTQTNTESENERQLELFKAQLNVTMCNFNLAHRKDVEG